MSNFTQRTKHPITGKFEDADWLDNYFSGWAYGVRFPDGTVFRAADYKWEFDAAAPAATKKGAAPEPEEKG